LVALGRQHQSIRVLADVSTLFTSLDQLGACLNVNLTDPEFAVVAVEIVLVILKRCNFIINRSILFMSFVICGF
jgi:hypothetical protein